MNDTDSGGRAVCSKKCWSQQIASSYDMGAIVAPIAFLFFYFPAFRIVLAFTNIYLLYNLVCWMVNNVIVLAYLF